MGFMESFKAARRAAVPIVAVETLDQQGTVMTVTRNTNGDAPIILWDGIRGFSPVNDKGVNALNAITKGDDPTMFTNPSEALSRAAGLPPKTILFFSNAQRFYSNEYVVQGIANLREVLKGNGATLVLLVPTAKLPDELQQDVMVIGEPLPNAAEVEEIVKTTLGDAGLPVPDDLDKITDTLIGLSGFAAEQTLATCLSKSGIDRAALWERKCKQVSQTPGLSIWRGGETFDDLGGCLNIKGFLRNLMKGKDAPRAIVFMDEIEKAFAGSGTDSSGVSQDQLGTILSWMQDKNVDGCIFIGPPGAAKSAIAKSAGAEAGIPTISFDLGAMKASLVGQSGQQTRQALQVIDAVSQGRVLCIATCNSITSLPPELRRRFTMGTWFFDLPTAEERKIIWNIYLQKFKLEGQELPEDEGWTGAEIRQCSRLAYKLGITLVEASSYIVPVSKSAADTIQNLQRSASGKYIDAGRPGVYQAPSQTATARRAIQTN